jgi:ATP-dependent RNA helicase SUPV3L1/SUV3
VFARSLLSPAALRTRSLLVRVHRGADEPRAPANGGVSVPRHREVPSDAYLAAGLVPLGPRAIRADIVERVLARLAELDAPFALPPEIGRWLGVRNADRPRVLAALGFRSGEDGWYSAGRDRRAGATD